MKKIIRFTSFNESIENDYATYILVYKIPNSYVDDMNNLISILEVNNDKLAFSLRHIKELI